MLAPGRIAGATAPTPVLKGLIESRPAPDTLGASLGDLKDTVRSAIRSDDPYIRRLQALHALLNGEPELTLIGTCTALEWFINQRFPDLTSVKKGGESRTGSIRAFLGSRHASVLPPETIQELRHLLAPAIKQRTALRQRIGRVTQVSATLGKCCRLRSRPIAR